VQRSDDNGTVHGLVAAGAGFAFVPQLVADTVNGKLAVLGIEESLPPAGSRSQLAGIATRPPHSRRSSRRSRRRAGSSA
jgi:DNA-binding transcriptional LysR family regulator